ncbi:MAG: histone deacetylase [Cyanobacteria bacterium]|nr:histone deacetylase [Cyanobacteriota bacterium]
MNLPLVYHPDYVAPIPEDHRFPMEKFSLLYGLLLENGTAHPDRIHRPELPPRSWIELVHDRTYIDQYCTGTLDAKAQRRIGLPWNPAVVRRTQLAVGGTVLTARLALQHGLACNLAGGTHHAFPDYGSGFCIFNDLAIAAKVLLEEGQIQKVLIIDLDVHQGDGTAWIFRSDPRVFTFSMHCEDNFPLRKQASDLDVPLPVGLEDDAYLQCLDRHLDDLLSHVKPDLVLYDAGVDVHGDDRLGKLALTDTGLFRREMQVLTTCIGAGYPVACVIGGGYCPDLHTLAQRHALVHRAAAQVWHWAKL